VAQDAGQVREAIAQDRAEIAETVQALARKADVKARAKDTLGQKAHQAQQQLSGAAGRARDATPDQARAWCAIAARKVRERPLPAAVVVAFVVGMMVGCRAHGEH
jgi:ElaB/YqjD/DUF883 family membrane-anchored ribosome-binding protein